MNASTEEYSGERKFLEMRLGYLARKDGPYTADERNEMADLRRRWDRLTARPDLISRSKLIDAVYKIHPPDGTKMQDRKYWTLCKQAILNAINHLEAD